MNENKAIYYFGYGSNMSTDYLINRRKVVPLKSEKAVLNDYKLIMNMEGPNFLEPSFANIKEEEGSYVEGILHKIHKDDLKKIVNTEGENYQLVDLSVKTEQCTRKSCSLIYLTDQIKDIPSSKRYLTILINAAKKSNLSEDYIKSLEKRPYIYYPVLSELFSIRVYLWVWFRT